MMASPMSIPAMTSSPRTNQVFDIQTRLKRIDNKDRINQLLAKFSRTGLAYLRIKSVPNKPELLVPHFLSKWLGTEVTWDRVFTCVHPKDSKPTGTVVVVSQPGTNSPLFISKKPFSIVTDKCTLAITPSDAANFRSIISGFQVAEFCPYNTGQSASNSLKPVVSGVNSHSQPKLLPMSGFIFPAKKTSITVAAKSAVNDQTNCTFSHQLSLITISDLHNPQLKQSIREFLCLKRLRPVLKVWVPMCLHHPNVKFNTLCKSINTLLDSSKLTARQFFVCSEPNKLSIPAGCCYIVLDGHNWWPKSDQPEPYRHGVTFVTVQTVLDDLQKNRLLVFTDAAKGYLPKSMTTDEITSMFWKIVAKKSAETKVKENVLPTPANPAPLSSVKPLHNETDQTLSTATTKKKNKSKNKATVPATKTAHDEQSKSDNDSLNNSPCPSAAQKNVDGPSVSNGEDFDAIVARLPCFGGTQNISSQSKQIDDEGPESLNSQDASQPSVTQTSSDLDTPSPIPLHEVKGASDLICGSVKAEASQVPVDNKRKKLRRDSSSDSSSGSATPPQENIPSVNSEENDKKLQRKYDLSVAQDREQLRALLIKKLSEEDEKMNVVGDQLKRLRSQGNIVLAVDNIPTRLNLIVLNVMFDTKLTSDNIVVCADPSGKHLAARLVLSDSDTATRILKFDGLSLGANTIKVKKSDMKGLENFIRENWKTIVNQF